MASRLVRGTAIAGGAIAGLGIGYAAGKPVDPKDILPARKLPADLCSRLGDVSQLLPKATTGTPPPKLVQTGGTAVRCSARADPSTQPTHTAAVNSTPQIQGYQFDQRLLEHPLAEIWHGRSFTGPEIVALVLTEVGSADPQVRDQLNHARISPRTPLRRHHP
jgi:hypothetical protein